MKYTQEDFDNFEIVNGRKICPSGDYTQIKTFGERCSFGRYCSFGRHCSFGEWCSFGKWCSFGEGCSFGRYCSFGKWCSFVEGCSFGEGCSHEGLTNSTYFACDRIGSEKRKTYFFKSDEGYYVRAGCFWGTFGEFENKVKKVHSNTRHEQEYLMALKLAEIVLG